MAGDVRTIGLVGGTGPAGRGVALRLAANGFEVAVGSRDAARAQDKVDEWLADWSDRGLAVTGVVNDDALDTDLVVMAAPWKPVLELGAAMADALAGRTVVSMANALDRVAGGFLPLTMPRGSVSAQLQHVAPRAHVVGAFHHLPAGPLADLDRVLECDVLVCGDHGPARDEVVALCDAVEGLRGIDAGPLDSAGAIEAMTAVMVQVNVTHRTHSTLRLGGSFGED